MKNRYEIIERIGEGSFANVFKAIDFLNNIDVAIKVFSGEIIKKKRINHLINTEKDFL